MKILFRIGTLVVIILLISHRTETRKVETDPREQIPHNHPTSLSPIMIQTPAVSNLYIAASDLQSIQSPSGSALVEQRRAYRRYREAERAIENALTNSNFP